MTEPTLSDRIAAVRARIAVAARRASRDPGEITLVAVSKTHGPEAVVAAYAAGLCIFGENRVEEAAPKAQAVASLLDDRSSAVGGQSSAVSRRPSAVGGQPSVVGGRPSAVGGLQWHMIGHLQSRKAEEVLPWADMVHSVDSVKLAARLSRFCVAAGRELPILLEANVSGEASKYGLTPAELPAAVEAIAGLPGLCLQGLMTMAPIVPNPEEVRPVFAGLRGLQEQMAHQFPAIDWRHLSMGMTDDFEVAIEEGATMVRIGRAIFGERSGA